MKVSLSWLRDYLDFPANLSAEDIAAKLTFAGTEVEGIETVGQEIKDVIVAKVLETRKHPNADKLNLCKVDTGKGVLDVVCGAANVRKDLTVAFAPVGSVLPGDFKIKTAKIRGEESFGMICSQKELGLAETSEGIMELPNTLCVGMPLIQALGLDDRIFTLAITPNRPDLLGHVGVARELSALLGIPQKTVPPAKGNLKAKVSKHWVEVQEKNLCPTYLGRILKGVKAVASPQRIQQRLSRVGLRPINILVDATNYVSLELGQPSHAFDLRFVAGPRISVRLARAGESLRTLDGKDCKLEASDLLICDAEKPVALAGVMGGENSQILPDTTAVLLEVAYFQPSVVRKTARRLGLVTDSSYRFERGVDPLGQSFALDRLTQLVLEWTQEVGEDLPEVIEDAASHAPNVAPRAIDLSLQTLNDTLGTQLAAPEVTAILKHLGIGVEGRPPKLACLAPTFRPDLLGEIDLIEEVARVYGFENIPETLPATLLRTPQASAVLEVKEKLGETFRAFGFCESITFSFMDPADLEKLNLAPDHALRQSCALANPLAADQSQMRTTLLPALLHAVAFNHHREQTNIRLYEINKVFWQGSKGPEEAMRLAAVMAGQLQPESWGFKNQAVDFYDLKAVLEAAFNGLGSLPNLEFSPVQDCPSYFHPQQVASLRAYGREVGFLGAIHPRIARNFDIAAGVFAVDLDLTPFLQAWNGSRRQKFHTFSIYPSIRRDLALVVDEEISAKRIQDLVVSMKIAQLETVFLFDIYRGKPVPEGKKSLAFAVLYNAGDRTLTHEEVDNVHQKIVERCGKEFSAALRT